MGTLTNAAIAAYRKMVDEKQKAAEVRLLEEQERSIERCRGLIAGRLGPEWSEAAKVAKVGQGAGGGYAILRVENILFMAAENGEYEEDAKERWCLLAYREDRPGAWETIYRLEDVGALFRS